MIIGFSFRKIHIEKKTGVFDKLDINSNVSIVDVVESDVAVGKTKQKGLTFIFEYTSKYAPNVADMLFTGEVIYLGDPKTHEEIMKGWKAGKKIPKDIMNELIDSLFMKCNMQAIILSRDLNLPPPVPMPRVKRD